jgi:hypothetical protein
MGKLYIIQLEDWGKIRKEMPDNWESIYSFIWEKNAEHSAMYVANI